MAGKEYANFQERVQKAAEVALEQNGSVGPLDVFQQLGFLHPVHVEAWRKGIEYARVLEHHIQVGPDKFQKTIRHFQDWVKRLGLRPIAAEFTRRTPGGIESIHVTEGGGPEWEKFYQTRYIPADLSEKKTLRVAEKLKKAPELVVFEKAGEEGNCSECRTELPKGSYITLEQNQPLCLTCADMNELVFLPAGDATLSRRARKYSSLSAVVVRFSRARKRYERQGLLITEDALARAENECASDAPQRAMVRERAAIARQAEDCEFVSSFCQAIIHRYPQCPPSEAREIAGHTGRRSSGRVGRSAAGRALDPAALDLAVIAYIRHKHTNYDELLMRGVPRLEARGVIREKIDVVRMKWLGP